VSRGACAALAVPDFFARLLPGLLDYARSSGAMA